MRKEIEQLIQWMKSGEVTAYSVWKESSVSESLLTRLKSGEVKVSNLKLGTAEKLYNHYKKLKEN